MFINIFSSLLTAKYFSVELYESNNLDFVDVLKNSEPSIWTRVPDGKDTIEIHVFGMTLDQSKIVGKVIKEKLEGLMI